MANFTEQFVYTTGLTLYAYPINQALADWATYRVLCTETSGKYSATVDNVNGTRWLIFSGATQPTSYNEAVYVFDTASSITLLEQHSVTQAAIASVGVSTGVGLNFEPETDNVLSPIKGISFVGVQTSGTFVSLEAGDGIYHQIDDTTNAIDVIYQFNVEGIRKAVQANWFGYLSGSNDTITIQAYDYIGLDWETRTTISGQAGTDNITINIPLLQKHTGTGVDAGQVLIRFVCSAQSNPTLYTDSLLVEGTIANQSVGYANGAVWVDTNASNTNTTNFVDGVADNPVSSWSSALTIAANLGLTRFEIAPGSSITLSSASDSFQINAPGSTINLNGQSVNGTFFKSANISGNDDGSNTNPTIYLDCIMNSNTLGLHKLKQCGLSGNITLTQAGTYDWTFCNSEVAGTSTPSVDVGALVGNTNLNIRHYSGGIELRQLGATGTDNVSIEGNGQVVINANCVNGVVTIRGNFKLTDNSGGAVEVVTTISTIGQVNQGACQGATNNTVTLSPTASSVDGQYDPASILIITGTGSGQIRNIIDYNGTTKVAVIDKDWRVNPDTTSSYVVFASSGNLHVNEGLAQAGAISTITLNTSASSVDDIYNGQVVFLVAGTGQDQSRLVVDYNGTTKVATLDRPWNTTPNNTTSYVMLPLPGLNVPDAIFNGILAQYTDNGTFGKAVSDILQDTGTDIPLSINTLSVANNPTYYVPTSATRVIGSDGGGDYTLLNATDESYMITGEELTGLDLIVERATSTVDEALTSVKINGYYDSNDAGHEIQIYAWNYVSNTWQLEAIMHKRAEPFEYTIALGIEHTNGSGTMRLRFLHNVVGTYKVLHSLYLDSIVWEKVQTNASLSRDIAQILENQQSLERDSIIAAGYAQGPGLNNNQIQLATNASIVDGSYDPSLITIVSGPCAGQTRIILEYDGTTKTAVVHRDWKDSLPTTASRYVITSYADTQSVNEGLARTSTANTIQLNADASTVDNVYNGQIVFILSGTGQDQSGLVIDYDGATQTATLDKDWAIQPDTTSAYVMIPAYQFDLVTIKNNTKLIPGML